jgi:hypothetical protein
MGRRRRRRRRRRQRLRYKDSSSSKAVGTKKEDNVELGNETNIKIPLLSLSLAPTRTQTYHTYTESLTNSYSVLEVWCKEESTMMIFFSPMEWLKFVFEYHKMVKETSKRRKTKNLQLKRETC